MIVCSCNLIRENDIRAAARRGAKDADAAYRAMGCAFQCGGCEDLADEIVADVRSTPRLEPSRAA